MKNKGVRIVMNMSEELHNKLEDYRILKRLKFNNSLPKTSEGIVDLMILGLMKLEELISEKNDDMYKVSKDESFNDRLEELNQFKGK